MKRSKYLITDKINQLHKGNKMSNRNTAEGITIHDTDYALAKQIHKELTISTSTGEIALTGWEQDKLRDFLELLLEGRAERLAHDPKYNA